MRAPQLQPFEHHPVAAGLNAPPRVSRSGPAFSGRYTSEAPQQGGEVGWYHDRSRPYRTGTSANQAGVRAVGIFYFAHWQQDGEEV